jgi:predicted enzyme related to lactoylglutathione lyase
MKINLASVLVDDQDKALKFYTEVLGFKKKTDMPMGKYKWLTVISPEGHDDVELLLEPNENAAAKAFQSAIFEQNIPITSFSSDNIQQEVENLKTKGVKFHKDLTEEAWGKYVMFEDTCGNLISLHEVKR